MGKKLHSYRELTYQDYCELRNFQREADVPQSSNRDDVRESIEDLTNAFEKYEEANTAYHERKRRERAQDFF